MMEATGTQNYIEGPHLSNMEHCLICNTRISKTSRGVLNIFNHDYNLPYSHERLSIKLGSILGSGLSPGIVHSEIICKKCFKLLEEVDTLEYNLIEHKTEIHTKYLKTVEIRALGIEEPPPRKQTIFTKKRGRRRNSDMTLDMIKSDELYEAENDTDSDDEDFIASVNVCIIKPVLKCLKHNYENKTLVIYKEKDINPLGNNFFH